MNISSLYISGLQNTFKVKKIVLVVYVINVFFALAVALPFASVLFSAIGYSDALTPLATTFNFTAFNDFMREHGQGISGIMAVARWLIPIYFLVQIFLNGGIINAFKKENNSYSLSDFYKNCTIYFWRYLKVFLSMAIFQVIALVIVIIPMVIVFSKGIDNVASEATYWTTSYWGLGVAFVFLSLLMLVSDYAKILLTDENAGGIFKTIFKAWKLVFKNFLSFYGLFLVNLIVITLVYWIYLQLGDVINPSSGVVIFLFLIIQQIINLIRIATKFTYFGSITALGNKL